MHRDSYPSVKPSPYSQPGTPAETVQPIQESTESRLTNLEHTLYEMNARLARSEENSNFIHMRTQVMTEALSRSLSVCISPAWSVFGLDTDSCLFIAELRNVTSITWSST